MKFPLTLFGAFLLAIACTSQSRLDQDDEFNNLREKVDSADAVLVGTVGTLYFLSDGKWALGLEVHQVLKGSSYTKTSLVFSQGAGCRTEYEPNVEYMFLTSMNRLTHDITEYCGYVVEASIDVVSRVDGWILESEKTSNGG